MRALSPHLVRKHRETALHLWTEIGLSVGHSADGVMNLMAAAPGEEGWEVTETAFSLSFFEKAKEVKMSDLKEERYRRSMEAVYTRGSVEIYMSALPNSASFLVHGYKLDEVFETAPIGEVLTAKLEEYSAAKRTEAHLTEIYVPVV
ncbi:MAG: hypothetical protein ACP5I3_10200 [Thermoproteus sp.]